MFMQNLAVDMDVKAGKIIPSQYLILSFSFASIDRSSDIKVAEASLRNMIIASINQFYSTYEVYLGHDGDELIQKLVKPDDAIFSLAECVRTVQMTLRANEGVNNHLADVKGVSSRLCLWSG